MCCSGTIYLPCLYASTFNRHSAQGNRGRGAGTIDAINREEPCWKLGAPSGRLR